jgi:hypothetical protein
MVGPPGRPDTSQRAPKPASVSDPIATLRRDVGDTNVFGMPGWTVPRLRLGERVIDGVAVTAQLRAAVAADVAAFVARTGRPPGLATVRVGDDPASAVYVANKIKACEQIGIAPSTTRFRPTRPRTRSRP